MESIDGHPANVASTYRYCFHCHSERHLIPLESWNQQSLRYHRETGAWPRHGRASSVGVGA